MKKIENPVFNINSINFVSDNCSEADIDLFFAPIEIEEVFIRFPLNWTLANIAVACGIFPSLSQARKNRHDGDIPFGFSCWEFGKKRLQVWIYKKESI